MEKYRNKLIPSLFYGLLLLLLLPMIQQKFSIFSLKPLKGAIRPAENIAWTGKAWFSGEFQEKKEKYCKDAFGFRSTCLRLHNQMQYNLFQKVSARAVVIGKYHYLYGADDLKSYYGTDFTGRDSILHRVQRMKLLQDSLEKRGKHFLFVIAPCKGSFYPEYFPDSAHKERKIQNYSVYKELIQQYKIHYIDFSQYFLAHKYDSPYPLYPQFGIHWSTYGAAVAEDSLLRYIEKTQNIDLPNLYWKKVDWAYPRETDMDIADALNLFSESLFKITCAKMGYPHLQYESDSNKVKPRVLVIGDSFYWNLFNMGINEYAFSESHYWYYNKQIYPGEKEIQAKDLAEGIQSHETIILLATEATLPKLGWGFLEESEKYFKGE